MEYKEVVSRLEAGEKAIDLSIEKWEEGIKNKDWYGLRRWNNCGLCVESAGGDEGFHCGSCVLDKFGFCCIDSSSPFSDFCGAVTSLSSDIADKANVMLDVLKEVKEKLIKQGEY